MKGRDLMSIGKRIKALRIERNLTLEYVGQIIGASKQNLYKYENEIITNIPSDKIEKLAVLYGVSPCYIMGWEVPNTKNGTESLSQPEHELISDYRQLNTSGKEKVKAYVNDIKGNPSFTEPEPDEKEEAASSA